MPPDDPPSSFNPKRMLEILVEHRVNFVVVGGVAATVHASPYPTVDLDICPEDDDANLTRLAGALEDMAAAVRITDEPEPISIHFTPRVLRALPFFNTITRYGALDILLRPAATDGYRDLAKEAIEVEIGTARIRVASRFDVIRMKNAVRRPKDELALEVLLRVDDGEKKKGLEP